jgi:prophage regulatory protein
MPTIDIKDDRVVREVEAARICGFSIYTLRRRIKDGTGPKRIRLSPKRIGYRLSDLHNWLDSMTEPEATAA